MEFITVNQDNIENEHICCVIAEKKGETCVPSKKAWLKERFHDGLIFRKLDVRGKVFIEYIPAEKAWCPILADGYMHINCFWVSGQFKGQGYANQLLEQCIEDAKAKGKYGLTILSSAKKMPFLSDPKHLKYKGFQVSDTAAPYFELLYLPFDENAPVPKIKDCAKCGKISEKGMILYYSNQCPHTDKYAPIIKEIAQQHGTTVILRKIETLEQAQNAPSPFTTYSFFYEGDFVTNEIL
ncbi:MAG: GNAT family N-acetyltransferase, partial [Clostridiales bacterium]|nr:GNAT family N-acetyltransferase [Clostridiales bacterium]